MLEDMKNSPYSAQGVDSINDLKKKVKEYIKKCAEIHQINQDQLKKLVWKLVCERQGHRKAILESKNLFIKVANSNDPVWECPECRRPHLHNSGRICSNCSAKLEEETNVTCKDLYKKKLLFKVC